MVCRWGSDWEDVAPRSPFPFSKKRAHCGTDTHKEMWVEEPQVKAPMLSSRRRRAAHTIAKLVLVI